MKYVEQTIVILLEKIDPALQANVQVMYKWTKKAQRKKNKILSSILNYNMNNFNTPSGLTTSESGRMGYKHNL